MRFSVLILSYLVFSLAHAQSLEKVLEKYSGAKSLQFEIKKTDEKMILGIKSETEGVLKYQKGQIYIIQNGEKKVEIFYVNKKLTLVEYPDVDFDPEGKRKVTILKKSTSPLVKSLLNLFSNPKGFIKNFPVTQETKEDDILTFNLKSNLQNVKKLSVKINSKNSELNELSFVDDVDTKTTLHFIKVKFNPQLSKNDFLYKIQKSDEVLVQ